MTLLFAALVGRSARLLDADDVAVIVDDDLQAQHAEVSSPLLRDALVHDRAELLVHVLELLLDHSAREDIVLPEHLGGLLGDKALAAFHHLLHVAEHLPIDLLGGDMAAEARVIHNVERLAADNCRIGHTIIFIYDETSEECLLGHFVSVFGALAVDLLTNQTSACLRWQPAGCPPQCQAGGRTGERYPSGNPCRAGKQTG